MNSEQAATIGKNWAAAMKEDPDQTKQVVRAELRKPGGVKLVRKALKNRVARFWLKRNGAYQVIKEELAKAEQEKKAHN